MNHSLSSTAITHKTKSGNLAEDQIKIVGSNNDKNPNDNYDDSELLSTSKVKYFIGSGLKGHCCSQLLSH